MTERGSIARSRVRPPASGRGASDALDRWLDGLAPDVKLDGNLERELFRRFGRRMAVLFTDLSGYSKMARRHGLLYSLAFIRRAERLILPVIARHDGAVIRRIGDGMLAIFERPARALSCALALQAAVAENNQSTRRAAGKYQIGIGLGYGPCLLVGNRIEGEEVIFASKLGEDVAKGGEILVTRSMARAIGKSSPDWVSGPGVTPGTRIIRGAPTTRRVRPGPVQHR